jgi:hypothetical protein
MKANLWSCLSIATVTLAGFLTLPVYAQPMPREDVVDVPAIGELHHEGGNCHEQVEAVVCYW